MAARNIADGKRFARGSPTTEPDAYFLPVAGTRSNISAKTSQPSALSPPITVRSADATTPRTDAVTPARRIVVIRNTKHPQTEQKPVDLGDLGRSDSAENQPVVSNGHKSVYLIRRPILPPDTSKSVQESLTTNSLEHHRTPTPPRETITSPEQPRTPSPTVSPTIQSTNTRLYVPYLKRTRSKLRTGSPDNSPPIISNSSDRPTSSKRLDNYQHHIPYLRRSRTRTRTSSSVHTKSIHQPSSSPPPTQEEYTDVDDKPRFISAYWIKGINEADSPPPPDIVENEEHHEPTTTKTTQRKKTVISRVKSAKPVVLIHPNDKTIAVVEHSHGKGEPLTSTVQHSKSIIKTRTEGEYDVTSTHELVTTSKTKRTCLSCLSKYMCLIVIICIIMIIIGLIGIGVSAYFLGTNSVNNLTPKIVGIVISAVLVIATLCFLYIVLACIGVRDGYFSYDDDDVNKTNVGGRAYAIIPPSHPNAHLYIPRDYMRLVENAYPPPMPMTQTPVTSTSKVVHNQSTLRRAVTTIPNTNQQTVYRTNTAISGYENKSHKKDITIEMPERLVTERTMSPRSRERNLNKIVQNVGHVVEDHKKRYNGDVPTKVIVKVDEHATPTD